MLIMERTRSEIQGRVRDEDEGRVDLYLESRAVIVEICALSPHSTASEISAVSCAHPVQSAP